MCGRRRACSRRLVRGPTPVGLVPTPGGRVTDARRALPAVGSLLAMPAVQDLAQHSPRALVTEAIRAVVDRVRLDQLVAPADTDGWLTVIREELARREQYSLRPVFN